MKIMELKNVKIQITKYLTLLCFSLMIILAASIRVNAEETAASGSEASMTIIELPEDVYEYDEESGLCDFYLTLFEENEDGSYFREDEHQTERCYKREELVSALEGAGFELLGIFSDFGFSEINDTDERWYIAARAKK